MPPVSAAAAPKKAATLDDALGQIDERFSEMLLRKIDAVSYTHLDVYKRQLVDGVQRPSENGISDVMRIIQNGSQRRLVPNLLRRSIACPDTDLILLELRVGCVHCIKPVCNRRKRQPFNLPLENLPDNRRGFFIENHIAVFFVPAITIREIAFLELAAFHLCLERGRNFAGDVLRVKGVDHVLQRDDEAFAGAVRIKVCLLYTSRCV